MSHYIPDNLRQQIMQRADGRCEYCLIHQDDTPFTHQIDHVVARQHGGDTVQENLALACLDCNKYKGPNLSSVDPLTETIITLFNPRLDEWADHFHLEGVVIQGLTPRGRATAFLLRLNDSFRLAQRKILIASNRYPAH